MRRKDYRNSMKWCASKLQNKSTIYGLTIF